MDLLHRAKQEGGKFQNPVPTHMGGFSTMYKAFRRHMANKEETAPKQPLGPFHTDASVYAKAPASGLRVTWFGHAASLLEIDGVRVLLDPVWSGRASMVQWLGPKRFFAPTLPLEELPSIDLVLLSHDHYDHLDAGTIRSLATLNASARARYVCALGVGKRLRKFGVAEERITELDWTQSTTVAGDELGQELTITCWPARHFSGRTLFDRFTTLWASFVIEGASHRVYFGGDSGYWDGFTTIGERYGHFDLNMLQVGAFDPLWRDIHMDPEDAARAYSEMGGSSKAGLFMPIHWALFNLALHGWRRPIELTTELADVQGFPLFSPMPGEPTEVVAGQQVRSGWWMNKS